MEFDRTSEKLYFPGMGPNRKYAFAKHKRHSHKLRIEPY